MPQGDGVRTSRGRSRAWLAVWVVSTTGCYLSHQTAADDAAVVSDGGTQGDAELDAAARDAAPGLDATAERDAAVGEDAGPECAPAGAYPTRWRVVSAVPEGCFALVDETTMVDFPFEDYFPVGPDCTGGLTALGDCEWAVSFVCSGPFVGYGSYLEGVLRMEDGHVSGQLDLETYADPGSTCATHSLLGDSAAAGE